MMCQPPILSYIKSNQEAVRQHFIFLQYEPSEPGFINQMLTTM